MKTVYDLESEKEVTELNDMEKETVFLECPSDKPDFEAWAEYLCTGEFTPEAERAMELMHIAMYNARKWRESHGGT